MLPSTLKTEMRRPKSKRHTQASRSSQEGIELQVRSSSSTTDPKIKREMSEADLLIQDLVDSHLPDPDIDDSDDGTDVVSKSSAAIIENIVDTSSTGPSVNELVNQAIAGVPFPDEFPPDKTDPLEPGPLDITGPVSPRTGVFVDDVISAETEVLPKAGREAAAFVDGVISSVTDGGVNANGAKEISRDSDDFDVLGDKQEKIQLGEHAQSLLEQVVNSSVGLQDIETSYTGKNTAEELLPPPPGEGAKQPIVIPAETSSLGASAADVDSAQNDDVLPAAGSVKIHF